ncbi:YpmS family protein [Salinibacillus xinjiangensis]|uniref:DUF2140 family protein n=1 Tax=Salinibacillus xinjiangensis TaxID=1229268 RepID=A0A6G1X5V0_9BACI|nr:YpmS family protein [Salinibacillus xinjiangensis]MRG86317.1 DUF2140 family protein [Salinibacillus xinjiangensis]
MQNMKNKWKIMFYGLAGFNIFIVIWLLLLILLPINGEEIKKIEDIDKGEAEFTISSTKENINKLVNTYLDELSKHSDINYSINIGENVQLIGTIVAFDREIPLTARFIPEVQDNGDLILNLESISLGRLELPNKKVLEYVKKNYPMPEWVVVNPGDENIYAAVTQMEMKSNFNVRVEQFNLTDENLAFKITVPNQTFDLGGAF